VDFVFRRWISIFRQTLLIAFNGIGLVLLHHQCLNGVYCIVVCLSGSKLGSPTGVIVQDCPSPGTCVLHKGVNASFGVDFKSSMYICCSDNNCRDIQCSWHCHWISGV